MRWVFLLLLMLNFFYYGWHQQSAPLRPKEVTPLSLYKGNQQGLRLLSEAGEEKAASNSSPVADECLYLGGELSQSQARTVEQRLTSLDIQTQFGKRVDSSGAIYWLKVAPGSRRLFDDALLSGLKHDFPQLKNKIMLCEGIATAE
ncbi:MULTISPECIES: hypothetical protein [unclassified Pseudomonas]|uniref:hypothetical protein n=1 Tax=unclassified Pseudomonas TaxID=196821 RepID=UPI0025D247A8|nr:MULTISPECIES: hypothetical protein [unclassified Pseudomonas]